MCFIMDRCIGPFFPGILEKFDIEDIVKKKEIKNGKIPQINEYKKMSFYEVQTFFCLHLVASGRN